MSAFTALTMGPAKAIAIYQTFSATTDADRENRTSAERTIQQQYQTDSSFFYHLFEFLVVDPSVLLAAIPDAQNNAQNLKTAQMVVAVSFRNFILGRTFHNEFETQTVRNPVTGAEEQKVIVTGSTRMASDWRKNDLILPDARLAVRNNLIGALLAPHVSEFIRLQLLAVVEHVIGLELVSRHKVQPKKKKSSTKKAKEEPVHEPWHELAPALISELNRLCESLQQLGAAAAPKAEVLVVLQQQHVLLRVLRLCCKRITNMMEFNDETESEAFYDVAVPIAVRSLSLSSAFLKQEYGAIAAELQARDASLDKTTAPHTAATNACADYSDLRSTSAALSDLTASDFLFDTVGTSPLQALLVRELGDVAYMALKCLWPIVGIRTPRVLCDAADGQGFDQLCAALIEAWRLRADLLYSTDAAAQDASAVPVELQQALTLRCAAASQSAAHRMSFGGEGNKISTVDFAEIARESHFWRLFKWITKIMNNFQLHFGLRNKSHVDKNERAVAHRFLTTVATKFLPLSFLHIQWHHQPSELLPAHAAILHAAFASRLTSPSALRVIEYVEAAVDTASLYHGYILPTIAAPLMTRYLFDRLAFTEEDHGVWRENPEEYVRAQTGDTVTGRAITVRAVSMSCILKLVTEAPPADPEAFAAAAKAQKGKKGSSTINKKDPEGTASGLFFSFLHHLFAIFQARATARAAGSDVVAEQLGADAAMYAIAEMRETMLAQSAAVPMSQIEAIMTDFVFPELSASAPFLRARAVRLLSLFTRPKHMQWSSPEVYQRILKGALALLTDAELPVRMQTCFYLSGFIQHPYAKPVVTPDIVRLVEQYFVMMKEMDSDRVIRTLRKTIHCYADTLSQWAVQLCQFLVQHFSNLYSLSLRKSAEQDARDADGMGGCGSAIDQLSSGGKAPQEGGQDVTDVLEAADELIETLHTLIASLPKNEGATADPALAEVFAGIQRAVLPMVLHLLHAANPSYAIITNPAAAGADNGEGTSFSFLDGLLGMVTLLIEQSNHVVPELWEIFSGLQGLVLYGGVADYFGSIIAPLDNAITVDIQGFLAHSGRSWKGVSAEAIRAGRASPPQSIEHLPRVPLVQLVRDMCDKVLLEDNGMRLSEMAAAPKIIECILLRIAIPPAGIAIADDLKANAVRTLVPCVVQCAMTRPSESLTFTYLLAMSVFAGLLVHSHAAFAALAECGLPTAQFFGHIVQLTQEFLASALSEADGSGPQILQMRQLQIISSVYTHLTREAQTSPLMASDAAYAALVGGVISALQPVIGSVVSVAGLQTQNMIQYAQEALANAKASGTSKGGDDEDSEDDDEDYDEGDEYDDDGSDDDGDMGDGEFADMDTNNVIQHLAKKAQALYGDDDDEDEDDGEADENQLEDFEASSVIDKVNVWSVLAPILGQAGASADIVGNATTLASMFEQLNQLTDQVVQASSPTKK